MKCPAAADRMRQAAQLELQQVLARLRGYGVGFEIKQEEAKRSSAGFGRLASSHIGCALDSDGELWYDETGSNTPEALIRREQS